jgi:hypothetical protein
LLRDQEIGVEHLPGGGAEQDPEEWWSAAAAAGREAVEASGVPAEDVIAVRATTQWAVTVPVDSSGAALSNAISWMDTRGARHVRKVVGGPVTSVAPDDFGGRGDHLHVVEAAPPDGPPEERCPGRAGLDQHPPHRRTPGREREAQRPAAAAQVHRGLDSGEQAEGRAGDVKVRLDRPGPDESSGLRLLEHLEQTGLGRRRRVQSAAFTQPCSTQRRLG